MPTRDTFCSYCGTRFASQDSYPRTCGACGAQTWANPVPVAVALVPVTVGARTGLLVVRRAIPPVGALALVGGFVEEHESWQVGVARELREEVNVSIEPASFEPLWFASSEPRPNRVLMFGLTKPIDAARLPPFVANSESSERGVIFGPGIPGDTLGFPLHAHAARRFFGADGALAFVPM
ncbi:MAG TPA: NUDIX domain-containing protein [Kofleriaceae bacterium]|nr:NUDIX domain-containing protein [Kofleriaceae bacterium]